MIAIVCGGRKYLDRDAAFEALDAAHSLFDLTHVIEGGQRTYDDERRLIGGGDWWANRWAAARGIRCSTERADWNRWGRAAGPIRNGTMLRKFNPDICLGLPGGDGTLDMLDQAERAGVLPVKIGPWPKSA